MVSSDAPRKRLFLCCCEAGALCVAPAKRSVSPHGGEAGALCVAPAKRSVSPHGGEASASREKTHFPLAFSRLRCILYITLFRCFSGEMAERSKAAVSKTVNGISPFGGSNPPLSANLISPQKQRSRPGRIRDRLLFCFPRKRGGMRLMRPTCGSGSGTG